eukprot:170556_1
MKFILFRYIIILLLIDIKVLNSHVYSYNTASCSLLGVKCFTTNECCEGMTCTKTYIYTPDYKTCIYPTLAAVPSVPYNFNCHLEYAKVPVGESSKSIGCNSKSNIRMGAGFRNVRISKSLFRHKIFGHYFPYKTIPNIFKSYPLALGSNWKFEKRPNADLWKTECVYFPNDFEFEISTTCCNTDWDPNYNSDTLNKLHGLQYKLECETVRGEKGISTDWNSIDESENVPTVSCGFDEMTIANTPLTTRTIYPNDEQCVHKGFPNNSIIHQKCALRIYVGDIQYDYTLKESQYFARGEKINPYSLLDEPLPRMMSNIPTFECRYFSDENHNFIFCPYDRKYQCVGGGFENVKEISDVNDQNNVWMNWPLGTEDGNIAGYDDNDGRFPYNAECSHITSTTLSGACHRKLISSVNYNYGGWAANYGINSNEIITHAACCKINQELTDSFYYDSSEIPPEININSVSFGSLIFSWIDGGLVSFYSSWGTSLEILSPSINYVSIASLSNLPLCVHYNGVWSQ